MPKISLTNEQARRFLLAHHGLYPPHKLKGKDGVLNFIRRVGCIQFDPLNMVGRNPDLVLQARVADYKPELLGELLYQDRKLLDGWDKNMSIYPIEDWPYFHRRRQRLLRHYGDPSKPATVVLPQVRKELTRRGPLSSIDLDMNQTVDWSWAPTRIARAALESMFNWGELIVHHKVNTRKVYDFAHHHIPCEILLQNDANETEEQFHDWYLLRRIGAVGMLWNKAGDVWLGMHGIKSKQRKESIARLLDRDKVIQVHVEGFSLPLYMRSEDKPTLNAVLTENQPAFHAAIMAPLDNLLWDRKFIKALFDFEYVWEVYKPVADRRYGYYVLPILYSDQFVARFEPVRDKKSNSLLIKNWWWEDGVTPTEAIRIELVQCLTRFCRYLGVDSVQLGDREVECEDLAELANLDGMVT